MLRGLVMGLLLANVAFYVWTQGWLDGVVGVHAKGDREPERLAQQVRPESIQILPPSTALPPAPAAPSAPAAPLACWEAGPFGAGEVASAEAILQSTLPGGSWVNLKTDKPGAWIVYIGKFPDRDSMLKKVEELKRLKVPFDEVRNAPKLEPGVSLGRFDDLRGAEAALAEFAQRGVRSAKVVELTPPSSTHMLRVERADPALATQLTALRSDALGRGFVRCSRSASN
jgi:hypothetical protein